MNAPTPQNNALLISSQHNQRILAEASQKLVPWWSFNDKDILKKQTEQDPTSYLDSYYLFPVTEISINSDCNDIAKFIHERFQNILAAASHSGVSVALILSNKNGKSNVYLGFKGKSHTESNPELFESILNGILPGKKIQYDEKVNLSCLTAGHKHGGMVTGIPALCKDDKLEFNISSVARSLYGKDYLLAIISRPIADEEKQQSFHELIQLRDNLHTLVMQTIGTEKGSGSSVAINESESIGNSETKGHSFGSTAGIGFPTPIGFMGVGGTYAHNISNTDTKTKTNGRTDTCSENESRSLSIEQQNGYALELEKIADQYVERMIQGFGSGYWETSITFSTQNEMSSSILAGTFAGELSQPKDTLLPPPRIYLETLENQTLFIPKRDTSNPLFPKSLSSYITSEELALVSAPPVESVPGYEIQKRPALSLTDTSSSSGMILGAIADNGTPISNTTLNLSTNDLNKHLFVCGLTGSGKTTTVKHILKDLAQKENISFLVLESAKRDYRQLLANDIFKKNLNIFTIGDATVSPIRFNPFYIQEGVHALVHIDYLKAIFNASFSLYGPMPSIVEKCLHAIYIKKGWDLTLGTHPNFLDSKGYYDDERYQSKEHFYCFPTLTDLKEEIDHYIKTELDYKGELRDNIRTAIIVRLESLCVGAKGLMFNTHDFFSIEQLLEKNTILEMESLADDDDKAFFVGLILVLISEFRQKENPAVNPGMGRKGLHHFMVIEEAHRLLKNIDTERTTEMMGNPKGKAVEVFCNILSEMRSLGQGVAVVEQIPSKISPDVIKNSNTKIVHRLVSKDDQSLLAGSLSIDENDALYLNRLKTGHALCHKEGMGRPVECAVLSDVHSLAISDTRVLRHMKDFTNRNLLGYQAYQLSSVLGRKGNELVIRFFNSLIIQHPDEKKELIEIAKKELQDLVPLTGMQFQIDNALLFDYSVLQIMNLLNKGLYCSRNHIPDNLKTILLNTLNDSTQKSYSELANTLSIYWGSATASCFIERIIEQLSIQQLIENKLKPSFVEIEQTISSFILFKDEKNMHKIAQRVRIKMGGSDA
jgi:energy-coupling factor transporter ATP-binding protein EcfA2